MVNDKTFISNLHLEQEKEKEKEIEIERMKILRSCEKAVQQIMVDQMDHIDPSYVDTVFEEVNEIDFGFLLRGLERTKERTMVLLDKIVKLSDEIDISGEKICKMREKAISAIHKNIDIVQGSINPNLSGSSSVAGFKLLDDLIGYGRIEVQEKGFDEIDEGLVKFLNSDDGETDHSDLMPFFLAYDTGQLLEDSEYIVDDIISSTIRQKDVEASEAMRTTQIYELLASDVSGCKSAVLERIKKYLEKFGLDFNKLSNRWRNSVTRNKGEKEEIMSHAEIVDFNLATINAIEEEKPGFSKKICDKRHMANFGRWPVEVLLDQFSNKENRGFWATIDYDHNMAKYNHFDKARIIFRALNKAGMSGYEIETIDITGISDFDKYVVADNKDDDCDFGILSAHGSRHGLCLTQGRGVEINDFKMNKDNLGLNRIKTGGTLSVLACKVGHRAEGKDATGLAESLSEMLADKKISVKAPEKTASVTDVAVNTNKSGKLKSIEFEFEHHGKSIRQSEFVKGIEIEDQIRIIELSERISLNSIDAKEMRNIFIEVGELEKKRRGYRKIRMSVFSQLLMISSEEETRDMLEEDDIFFSYEKVAMDIKIEDFEAVKDKENSRIFSKYQTSYKEANTIEAREGSLIAWGNIAGKDQNELLKVFSEAKLDSNMEIIEIIFKKILDSCEYKEDFEYVLNGDYYGSISRDKDVFSNEERKILEERIKNSDSIY